MNLVDTTTGEIIEGRVEAPMQIITPDMVRASVRRAKRSLEKAAEEIVWQIEREAWRTLGYSSWNAMREAEYGDAAFMVPRRDRPELVGRMKRKLTNADIAATAGVSERTVERDLSNRQMSDSDEPVATITNSRGQQRPATYTRKTEAEPVAPDPAPTATPDPAPAEPVTCPTCNGTGKVTR